MSTPLRVLIIEDSEDDALLVVRELSLGGYQVRYKRVDSSGGLKLACDSEDWDLVISDHSMPHFSGTDALKLVRSRNLDVPFIFVSGTMGEETAVEAMRNGARDYLIKGNLKRLVPAVERELREYAQHQERKRLEKHVQQLQKFEAIGRLSGGIAHDFNNMIGAILGWAELGYSEAPPDSHFRTRFQKIRDQSHRAAKLTSQLLAFGRMQVLQRRKIDLNLMIREEMNFLEKVIGENISIRVLPEPNLWITDADRTQLQQVLMNLCLNARDAMPDGGQLTIETKNIEIDEVFCRTHVGATPGRYVQLMVIDTGTGIDPATAEHIFEPFFTTKEMGRGTGLGLATTYGIVKQHQGLIYMSSALGHGTAFQVFLPAAPGAPEPVESPTGEVALTGKETILFAEDHHGLRETIQEMLQTMGYTVIPASDGAQAVELFRNHHDQIALVVLDLIMPGLSGIDAYHRVCEIRREVPVVFTSGYAARSESLFPLLNRGAEFVQKPYTVGKLCHVIRRMLDRVP